MNAQERPTVLVTGATGFVGSHVLTAGWRDVELVAACRRPDALPAGFAGPTIVGDLRDPAHRRQIADAADIVCHAASVAHFSGHADQERTDYLEPTVALIDACKAGRVRRFVNLSSTSARPERDGDAMAPGLRTGYWPHMDVVVDIEDRLRELADDSFGVFNLRCGFFVGAGYNLGLLPALVPRLRTGFVPWVDGGRASAPLIEGSDIGHAFMLAATLANVCGFNSVNIVGRERPSLREVLEHLHEVYAVPRPRFSVPYWLAHAFGATMELISAMTGTPPFLTRGIVHLLRETHATGERALDVLGFEAKVPWKEAVAIQMEQMQQRTQTARIAHGDGAR